jgi:hypothetical protein
MTSRRLAPLVPLVALALLPGRAAAQNPKAVVLPATGEGVDSVTLEIVTQTLADKLPGAGFDPVDAATVATAGAQKCADPDCALPADAIAVGKACGAERVLSTHLVKEGEEVVIRMFAFDVQAGTSEQAAAKTTPAGVLSRVVKLLAIVLPEVETAPEPEPLPAPEPPEPEPPAPEPPGPAPIPPGGEPETPPVPPGEEEAVEAEGGEEEPEEEQPEEEEPEKELDQSGRMELALSSAMFGMTLPLTLMLAAGVGQDRWYYYPPFMLLGGGVALATSLLITWKLKVTAGDAAMFDACLGWGLGNGALIPIAAGKLDPRSIMIGVIVGSSVGLVGGILAAALFDPSRGDAALVSTFASWGSLYAAGITWMVLPDDPNPWRPYMIATLVGMDVGLAAGILAAVFLEVSPKRLGWINLAGMLGGLLGATVGMPIVLSKKNPGDKEWRGYGAMVVSFATLGLVLGSVFTAKMDRKGKKKNKNKKVGFSRMPFLVAHDETGWGMGVPAIMPVPAPDGSAGVPGALLGVAGGVF